jgi:hypothetical protein
MNEQTDHDIMTLLKIERDRINSTSIPILLHTLMEGG